MGLMDRDYMRRRTSTALLVIVVASAAVWLFRDPGFSAGSPEGTLRVNVNTATLAELETVPGIGPSLSKLVVAGRPYGAVDDLVRVRGIGPATLESIRPYVKTSGDSEEL